MAFYADDEEVWRCRDHPSRRRSVGVCAACLREKLSLLCPDCATLRPCACALTVSAASSSSSSSHSFVSFPGNPAFSRSSGGSVGRFSNSTGREPSFTRSRSVAFPFFKSMRFSSTESVDPASVGKSKSSFWLFFWQIRSKRGKIPADAEEEDSVDLKIPNMTRSKSVAASTVSNFDGGAVEEAKSGKRKGWYFPSPLKAFRNSKVLVKIIHQRSPFN